MTALPQAQSRRRKPADHAAGARFAALPDVTGLAPGALIARAGEEAEGRAERNNFLGNGTR